MLFFYVRCKITGAKIAQKRLLFRCKDTTKSVRFRAFFKQKKGPAFADPLGFHIPYKDYFVMKTL